MINEVSQPTDFDWIIYDTIYILIMRTGGLWGELASQLMLREPGSQLGIDFKRGLGLSFSPVRRRSRRQQPEGAAGRETGGLRWRWRGMGLHTSLCKWINPSLCHPVGLMCCISVKQLDGDHLYRSINLGQQREPI